MSLDWNMTKVTDKGVRKGIRNTSTTDVLIRATMALGLSEITAKNVDEWLVRSRIMAEMSCPVGWTGVGRGRKAWSPTRQDLTRRIGLYTNASTVGRNRWVKALALSIARSAEWQVRDELRKAAEAARKATEAPAPQTA